jgi:branched-chain amino acid transport system permease protein
MDYLQHLANGITVGSIYALIALGYTMVYGILKFINFAHGDILMMGTYAGLFSYLGLQALFPAPAWQPLLFLISLLAALTASALLGVVIEKVAYRPLRQAPRLAPLLSAIGVSIILMNVAALCFGTHSRRYELPLPNDPLPLQIVSITPQQILTLLVALAMMLGLTLFVRFHRWGKAMRAASENREAAALMGINVDAVISLTFALGSALAGLAGVLVALEYKVYPTMGTLIGLKAFIAAVIGGIGSIEGAMLGGLLLGLLETFGVAVLGIPQGLKDTIAFSLLILILLVKPGGLLGRSQREKI